MENKIAVNLFNIIENSIKLLKLDKLIDEETADRICCDLESSIYFNNEI